MRKLLLLIATLALAFGVYSAPKADATTPAGYFYLAPYTEVVLEYHGCTVVIGHGVYGTTSYSYVGNVRGCSGISLGIQTIAWGKVSSDCMFSQEYYGLPDKNDCDIINGNSTLQSVVRNNTGLLGTKVTFGPATNYLDYVQLRFSPIS